MIKNRLLAVLACAAVGICISTASTAKGLTYSYGDAGYNHLNSDEVDGNGLGARLSYGATENIHIKADYTHFYSGSKKTGSKWENVDIDRFIIGMGGNYTLLKDKSWVEQLDVLGTLSYFDAEFSGHNNNADRGYVLEPGVRALFTKALEINARLVHMHVDNFHEEGFGGGVVYRFYKKYSLVGEVSHFSKDDTTSAFVGVRVNF